MNRTCAVVMLLLFVVIGNTQEVVVRDADDKLALSRTEVSSSTGIVIYTDRSGVFKVDTFKNDPFIFLSHNGYQTKRVFVSDISTKDPTIYLQKEVFDLSEALVTPKGKSTTAKTSQQIDVLETRSIQFGNPMTSASMLENTGLVAVQKSQLGGGSPILRGFEANKVLMIIDGVRMNNAIYRSGHVQNAITVDPNILGKTEVMFGPASVLYGSDALGGAIHFKTKEPALAEKFNQNLTRVNIIGRVASASQENMIHADVMVGGRKFGFLTSITRTEFGDLKMGKNRAHGYSDWGIVPSYILAENSIDQIRENGNSNIQKYTGYTQLDLLQKFTYKHSKTAQINLNLQYSSSTDIPRFDRLNDISNDKLKWAEWYYGPQNRFLGSLNLNLINRRLFTEGNFTLAYQRIDEDRIKRRFNDTSRFTNEEDVKVLSLNLDFILDRYKDQLWFYGMEFTFNDVLSQAFETNIQTGEEFDAISRYPNGGSAYGTANVYVNRDKSLSEKTNLNLGIRYNHTLANSELLENDFYTLPYNEININDGALTASASITHDLNNNTKLSGGISSGFKSPNVDDYGKIFEKDGFVVIPNADLKSELVYSADFTLEKTFLENKIKTSVTPYYTYLVDAIVRRDTTLNGSETMLFEGEEARVQTNKNAASAHIYGISSRVKYLIHPNVLAVGTFNWTYGQDLTDDVPMSHISPGFGKLSLSYNFKRIRTEAYMNYAFKKSVERYGPGTTDNLAEATEDGTPAWNTFNFRSSVRLSKTVILQAAIENLTDIHYKTFASGLSAPGRNYILSLKTFF